MTAFLDRLFSNTSLIFYLILGVVLLLTRIPIVGRYFRCLNTMIHEAGHAFITLIVSGELIAVNIFADTSGTTVTKAKNRFLQVMIAIAGYPVSAVIGFISLYLLSKGYYQFILFGLTSITLLLMILSIRNGYGLFWAGTFSLINLLLIYFNSPHWLYMGAAFFSLIILTDSVMSAVTLFVLSIRTPNKAGDATNLHKFTKIPAVIWSLLFLAFSGFMAYLAITRFFPPLSGIFNNA